MKRDVALKVLPPEFATDAGRRQRFESEARAIAALNHPNIHAIYDVGTQDSTTYIVTELVDGEPPRAGVGLRQILDCAIQIANGLAAAHDAGVVHRDLKPENILLTRDRRIKILDFGLARMNTPRTAAAAAETVTMQTEPGIVMGTVGYMSPEQVRGQETDHRSDIFSFGVVLYELLSGGRAFHGETSVETMTAILRQGIHPRVCTIIERRRRRELLSRGPRGILDACVGEQSRHKEAKFARLSPPWPPKGVIFSDLAPFSVIPISF